jgi:hypothetical protein
MGNALSALSKEKQRLCRLRTSATCRQVLLGKAGSEQSKSERELNLWLSAPERFVIRINGAVEVAVEIE